MNKSVIGIVGNPNCGKSTLFNALTKGKQRVGNWSGVTVERVSGELCIENKQIEIIDLPGLYSFTVTSTDEIIARDFIFSDEADAMVNIVDASNLERNLYLTVQLLEMQIPTVIALNMMDSTKDKNVVIDVSLLSLRLNCPVVPITATRKKGIEELKTEINIMLDELTAPDFNIEYPNEIHGAIGHLSSQLEAGKHK